MPIIKEWFDKVQYMHAIGYYEVNMRFYPQSRKMSKID